MVCISSLLFYYSYFSFFSYQYLSLHYIFPISFFFFAYILFLFSHFISPLSPSYSLPLPPSLSLSLSHAFFVIFNFFFLESDFRDIFLFTYIILLNGMNECINTWRPLPLSILLLSFLFPFPFFKNLSFFYKSFFFFS